MAQVNPHTEWVGRRASRDVAVTEEMLDRYAEISGDTSPIHMSAAAAQDRGFNTRVVHGLLLGSLVSGLLGTELPGARGVLHEVQLMFRRPCHPGDKIRVELEVVEFFESVGVIELGVRIVRSDGTVLSTGRVRSGIGQDLGERRRG